MKIVIILLLFCQPCYAMAAKIYTGTGEAVIAHITPEQARADAREQAMIDILQQATGIDIFSIQLLVNAQMASYHILQTHSARVINSACHYYVEHKGQLTQKAVCNGEVQAFGSEGPDISSMLLSLGNKEDCDYSFNDVNANKDSKSLFDADERFCLLINSHEDVYVGIFSIYHDDMSIKISRVYPDNEQMALWVKANEIPKLAPLSSQPLEKSKLTHEAFLVLASKEPLNMKSLLANSAGFSAEETIRNSVDIKKFDNALSRLDLDRITIKVLPYAVMR